MLKYTYHPLKGLNTFGIEAYAREYIEVQSKESLLELFSKSKDKHLILGGGSNVLFRGDFDGMVIRMAMFGKKVTGTMPGKVLLEVSAGEDWDDLVSYCVNQGWGGLENLSLIPGQVGSSPIQNIGAYGVELKDYFHSLTAFDKEKKVFVVFDKKGCRFGYRNSYFKQEGKDRFVITSVTFSLDKKPVPQTSYGSLRSELDKAGIDNPEIKDVRQAVCSIRRNKLPDPDVLGNAGSFFKNPVVSMKVYLDLKKKFPGLVAFDDPKGKKLAAGWLIENAGWKGYRRGDAGVHDKQALVLVNHGKATGKEIIQLADDIQQSVLETYSIRLDPEVNII